MKNRGSAEPRSGPLERWLRPFADVRAGEGLDALLLMFSVFLLLMGYYIIKVVREPLILAGGGAELKSYTAAGQAVLLLFLIPAYGAFASRVNRIRLITGMTVFFISNLVSAALWCARGALRAAAGGAGWVRPVAFAPILTLIRITKVGENSLDYSLNNTARHALFLPTSREAKYKAKAAIDTLFVRAGDLLSGGLVFMGGIWSLGLRDFALVNLAMTVVWLLIVAAIGRRHRMLAADGATTIAA